MKKQAIENKFL